VILELLLQAFAAFASVIGVGSGYLAFREWVRGGLDDSNPLIGQEISLGVAAFFVPALVAGAAVLSYGTTL
jgi:hypothetical protein